MENVPTLGDIVDAVHRTSGDRTHSRTTVGKIALSLRSNLDLALREAAKLGNDALVTFLLDQGASVTACVNESAIIEKEENNTTVGGWKPQASHTALHAAAGAGNLKTVQLLLKARADVDRLDRDNATALIWAAVSCKKDIIGTLIEAGACLHVRDSDGSSPLHYAAMQTAVPGMANGLLAAAGPEGRLLVNLRDNSGDTPLHCAALRGNDVAVEALLKAGAFPNATNLDNLTALHSAAGFGNLVGTCSSPCFDSQNDLALDPRGVAAVQDVMWRLIRAGADLNAPDAEGNTALHTAIFVRQVAAVEALLAAGADTLASNSEGITPRQAVELVGDAAIRRLFGNASEGRT